MAKKKKRPVSHLVMWMLLTAMAVLMLLPIIMTFLYSFFPTSEIVAFLDTRGSYDETKWMEIKLSPHMVSLRQYYRILIEDGTVLRLFVNSAAYSAAILIGQAIIIPMMAYALSRFRFFARDVIFFTVLIMMLLPFQAFGLLFGEWGLHLLLIFQSHGSCRSSKNLGTLLPLGLF